MDAYGGRCAITGYDVEEALQAAHIVPYLGPQSNTVNNGLLLRADVHNLFDSTYFRSTRIPMSPASPRYSVAPLMLSFRNEF